MFEADLLQVDEEQSTQDILSCIETYSGQAWLEDIHQGGLLAEEPLPTPLCVYRQEAGAGRWLRNKDSVLGVSNFALGTQEPTSMTSSSPCDLTQTCLLLSYQEGRRRALRQCHWKDEGRGETDYNIHLADVLICYIFSPITVSWVTFFLIHQSLLAWENYNLILFCV